MLVLRTALSSRVQHYTMWRFSRHVKHGKRICVHQLVHRVLQLVELKPANGVLQTRICNNGAKLKHNSTIVGASEPADVLSNTLAINHIGVDRINHGHQKSCQRRQHWAKDPRDPKGPAVPPRRQREVHTKVPAAAVLEDEGIKCCLKQGMLVKLHDKHRVYPRGVP